MNKKYVELDLGEIFNKSTLNFQIIQNRYKSLNNTKLIHFRLKYFHLLHF